MIKSKQEIVRDMLRKNPDLKPKAIQEVFPYMNQGAAGMLLRRSKFERTRIGGKEVFSKPEPTTPVPAIPEAKPIDKPVKSIEKPVKSEAKPTSVSEDKEKNKSEFWNEQYRGLKTKYDEVLKDSTLVDRLVSMAMDAAPKSYNAAPQVRDTRPNSTHSPQSAVLLLSDTHIGKVVKPEQTLYFGDYNFPKFLSRLKHLEERTVSILLDHTHSRINKLVVAMLGDMVDGSLSHGAEAGQINTVFTQVYAGAHAVAQFLRNLSRYVPLQIETVVGNHGRWGTQKKMPTKNRYSNLDMFFYALVQSLVRDIKTITFTLNEQPFKTFKVEETLIWIGHGDHLRGGDKAMGIPVHSIARQLSQTAQMHAKAGRQVPNIYCVGDKHKRIELPHANGDFIINGAFPGYDEYAHASNFTDTGADQKLFLIHPTYGRSATYNIYLTQAADAPDAYEIPKGFSIE